MNKIGLVLSGGGTLGFAHIGALKAFEEAGISFDCVAGTSVGSLVGAIYAYGKSADEILTMAGNVKVKNIYKNWLPVSPSSTVGIEELCLMALDGNDSFTQLKIPFSCVSICLNDAEKVVFKYGSLSKAVAASCSVPGIFKPTVINGKNYIDGGILDNLPVDTILERSCNAIVAIDLVSQGLGTSSRGLFDVLWTAIKIALHQNQTEAQNIADIVIKPDLQKYKPYKLKDQTQIYDIGYNAAKEAIPAILELINKPRPTKKRKIYKKILKVQSKFDKL